MTRSLRYVAFDQLHRDYGVLADARPAEDVIVMVESSAMLRGRDWHPERLFFYRSSARHFAQSLVASGFRVEFLKAASSRAGLLEVKARYPGVTLVVAEQSSFRQRARLADLADETLPNDFFLTPSEVFQSWANSHATHVMEHFYRQQRVRLGVLMEGGSPLGGAWNFDHDNRLPPPKNYQWPEPLQFALDEIDEAVAEEVAYRPSGAWSTTRAGALAQLENFLTQHFAAFGPYEDAMASTSWSMHHSLLSPYLNNGLLHPREVLDAVLERFSRGDIPIASAEGFVRQLIGWREYVHGMYWFQGPQYQEGNGLAATTPLLPLFDDATATSMNCVGSIIRDIDARAWTHHIPRLMVLSNLALLAGVDPQAFLAWMRRRFIDAAEWVMVPNVIGMGLHADGGAMMTKPYAAGGAYIHRMGSYCKDCPYNPKLRIGESACPFTTLYWDFLDRHRATFATNHRMAQQVHGLGRLADLPQVRQRAQVVLRGLAEGRI